MPTRRLIASLGIAALAAGTLVAVTALPGPAGALNDPIDEAIAASAAPGHSWTLAPASYGLSKQLNVAVPMADGTVLRADIATPTDPVTGEVAPGPFPVLLTQSPYGKDTAGQVNSSSIGIDPVFVEHGYIDVVVDVRGTGDSGGTFDIFDPKQISDGVALVNWAAALPHSTGTVGLHGASYLGIDQMLTAAAVGPHSPLKAIFPIVSANDVYRDTAFMGGIPDSEFDLSYMGALLPALNLFNPIVGALLNPANLLGLLPLLLQRLSNASANEQFVLDTYLGGPHSYEDAFWQAKSPGFVLDKIVANDIPAYLVGGEYDLFQRGEPLNYSGLQNAWAGRSVTAPMTARQRVTGRYQLLDGPYSHLTAALSPALDNLELEWFDTWLKGADTGMAQTPTPLHYYDLGTQHYTQSSTYPIAGAKPTVYYFNGKRSHTALSSNDGTLTKAKPTVATGADSITWLPVGSSICDRSIDQWAAGALGLILDPLGPMVPCYADDRLGQVGPTALTYTTAPMVTPKQLAGPIAATLYASANTTETEWVVNIEDVSPDGVSKPLTQGALLGSARAIDPSRTWTVNGKTLLPYHPYTSAAASPVTPNVVTKYEVEVFPTYSTIAAGHRIRVTLQSTDFPHLTPTPQALTQLFGGVYQVQRTATAPSSITLPLIG